MGCMAGGRNKGWRTWWFGSGLEAGTRKSEDMVEARGKGRARP